jgi:hypothetical protein
MQIMNNYLIFMCILSISLQNRGNGRDVRETVSLCHYLTRSVPVTRSAGHTITPLCYRRPAVRVTPYHCHL